MNDWMSFVTKEWGLVGPLLISVLTVSATILLQIFTGYNTRKLGYYVRAHGLDTTFLVRNLSSVTYRRRLTIRAVAMEGAFRSVVVQAGPWSPKPEPEGSAGDRVLIRFSEMPSDAVFVIRTRVDVGPVRLEYVDAESELKVSPAAFDAPLPPFTGWRAFTYFFPRCLIGILVFAVIFLGSVIAAHDDLTPGDWTVLALGAVIAVPSLMLVVLWRGKSTVAGYDSGMDLDQLWNGSAGVSLGTTWTPRDVPPA